MTDNTVDPLVYTELQEAMGSDFVDELVKLSSTRRPA